MKKIKSADDILDEILQTLGFTKDLELAKWLDVSAPAISQARKKEKVPESWLVRFAAQTGCSLDALLFEGSASSAPDGTETVSVPVCSGNPDLTGSADANEFFLFRTQWLRSLGDPENMFLLKAAGDSMSPVICHNDLVLVDRGKTVVVPHTVFAVAIDDEWYIKQLETLPGHRLILRNFNEKYPPIEIDMRGEYADSVKILGKALWWCHTV